MQIFFFFILRLIMHPSNRICWFHDSAFMNSVSVKKCFSFFNSMSFAPILFLNNLDFIFNTIYDFWEIYSFFFI